MKTILPILLFLLGLYSNSSAQRNHNDSKMNVIDSSSANDINWDALIKRDEVVIGHTIYDLSNVPMYSVLRVRFYRNSTEMSETNIHPDEVNVPFVQSERGRVVAVKRLNGGFAVYISTGDQAGLFDDLITLKGWASGTTFIVKGNVLDNDGSSTKHKKRKK